MERQYYSKRKNASIEKIQHSLEDVIDVFKNIYGVFCSKGYFQQHFGYQCVDSGFVPGELGNNIEAAIYIKLHKKEMWPIESYFDNDFSWGKSREKAEEDLFDMIEFLHDHCSKPIDGRYHNYANCGNHYTDFDMKSGQTEFREQINSLLCYYKDGYELSLEGNILSLVESGFENLFSAEVITNKETVSEKVEHAKLKFRRHSSSLNDRRDAIRELADILEFLRPEMNNVLANKDDADLFNIANNFGIRHHNQNQKNNYDQTIWYSWMFYFYLATVHAAIRFIEKSKASESIKIVEAS